MKLIRELLEVKSFDQWFSSQGAPRRTEPEEPKADDDSHSQSNGKWSQHRGSLDPQGPRSNILEYIDGDTAYSICPTPDGQFDLNVWDLKKDEPVSTHTADRKSTVDQWTRSLGIPSPSEDDLQHVGF